MRSTTLIAVAVVVGLLALHGVDGLRVTATAKQFVCTETFKAGLTSFFTQRDTKAAFAEDQSSLCEMCAKVMRLAYLYSNDAQTQATWHTALENNACAYVGSARKADCKALTRGVIESRRKYFDGKQSKFTRKELSGTTEQLAMLVDSRSYFGCKQVGCCSIIPAVAANHPKVLQPASKPGDQGEVAADRAQLMKDRFLMDKTREELFNQRRDNNQFKAKLDLHEIDLKGRETKLKKELEVLKQDQQKMREAREALKRREERVTRREKDEKEFEAYNKKQEKWLKERLDMVKDREDVCYKREEQLGIPHPPKSRPPPIPPAPAAPPSRPPSL